MLLQSADSTENDLSSVAQVTVSSVFVPQVIGYAHRTNADDPFLEAAVFSDGAQPMYTCGTRRKQYAIGMFTDPALVGERFSDVSNFSSIAPTPFLWYTNTMGTAWQQIPLPPYLMEIRRATAVALDTPSGDTLVCLIGGEKPCRSLNGHTNYRSTTAVYCSADNGNSWQAMPRLVQPVASASMVVTPYGPMLVAGKISRECADSTGGLAGSINAALYSGVQQMVWAEDGRSIAGWELLAYKTPLDAMMYATVQWSHERQALYVVAGTSLSGITGPFMWYLPPDSATDNITTVKDKLVDPSAWRSTPRLPENIANREEPEVLLLEILTGGYGWVDYRPEFIDETSRPVGDARVPLIPALALVAAGRVYLSASYGDLGWNMLEQEVWPSPAVGEVVHKRAVVPMYLQEPKSGSPVETVAYTGLPYTIILGGIVVRGSFARPSAVGQWSVTYPMIRCQPARCRVDSGQWSAGCRYTPFDATCSSCSTAPQCPYGKKREVKECGSSLDPFGFPSPPVCDGCTACPDGHEILVPCSGKNDTVCGLKRTRGPAVTRLEVDVTMLSAIFAVCLVLLLCSAVSSAVRFAGSRTGRAAMARAGPCCSIWTPREASTKAVQDTALIFVSASLLAVVRVLHLSLAWLLARSPSVMSVDTPSFIGALLAATILVPLLAHLLFCAKEGMRAGGADLVGTVHEMTTRRFFVTAPILLSAATGTRCFLLTTLAVTRVQAANKSSEARLLLQRSVLWNKVALFVFDFAAAAACLVVAAMCIVGPSSDAGPMDESSTQAASFTRAIAACAAVFHLVSLAFGIHVLQLAAIRQMIFKMSHGGARGQTGEDEVEQTQMPAVSQVLSEQHGAVANHSSRSSRVASLASAPAPAMAAVLVPSPLVIVPPQAFPASFSSPDSTAQASTGILRGPTALPHVHLPDAGALDDLRSCAGMPIPVPISVPSLEYTGALHHLYAGQTDAQRRYGSDPASSLQQTSSEGSGSSRQGQGQLSRQDLQLLAGILAEQLGTADVENESDMETRAEVQEALNRMKLLINIGSGASNQS